MLSLYLKWHRFRRNSLYPKQIPQPSVHCRSSFVRGKELAKEGQIRKEFIDYDARRKPRTKRFCVKCQKDLDPAKLVRRIYVTRDMEAVHPDDIGRYQPSDGDLGWWLIGNDCARILGMEWTLPEIVA